MDRNLLESARAAYLEMDTPARAQFLSTYAEQNGQEKADALIKYFEEGDFSELEDNIAKLEVGQVEEGGTTLAESYDRTPQDVIESMDEQDQCPIAELVETMGEEFRALPDAKQEDMIDKLEEAKGEEFSEAVALALGSKDFCRYVARETQNFYNTLAYEFSESNNKKGILNNISRNFSENVSSSLLDVMAGKMPKNFSVLEVAGLISAVTRRNFSENGELADALQELSDGALTPPEAETMATNVEATAPEAVEPLKEGAQIDDAVEEGKADFDDGGAGAGMNAVAETAGVDNAQIQGDAVREKEQNNLLIDALVEKLKALQTDEAKEALIADMRAVLPEETVNYVISRAQGEDFSEEIPNSAELAVSEQEQPTEEEVQAAMPDSNKYEQMAAQLLGPDAYTSSPVASVTTADAPIATATLPEGRPVSEGGTTLAEDYQRDSIIDNYQRLGLI